MEPSDSEDVGGHHHICYICTLIVNEVNDVQDRSACDVY